MEMRPVTTKKASFSDKLRGKKDEYKLHPQIVPMSGTDPMGVFFVGGAALKGLNVLGKTGLWNMAKYAPQT